MSNNTTTQKQIDKNTSELRFIELLIGLFIVYILVNLWQRVIDNFTTNIVGLSTTSAWDAFLVALAVTLVFFVIFSQLTGVETQLGQEFA